MKSIWQKHSYVIFLYSSILIFFLFAVLIMLSPLGKVTAAGGSVAEILDTKFFYNSGDVMRVLTDMGEAGRNDYTVMHLIDYFFLISYCMLMIAVTRPLVAKRAKFVYIILPLLSAVCDFVENTLIEVAVTSFPNISAPLANVIPVFTTLKWVFILLWLGVFCALAIALIIKKIHAKYVNKANL